MKKILKNHKKKSLFALVIIIVIVIIILSKSQKDNTQYIAQKVRHQDIQISVTGSGQITASNQMDISSLVSGNVSTINVHVGDIVKKGQMIATIDSVDAYRSLLSARLAYEKLTKPAKDRDVLEAKNKVEKDYKDISGSLSEMYSGIVIVMNGLKSQFTDTNTYLSQNLSSSMSNTGADLRLSAHIAYDQARVSYEKSYSEYKQTNNTDYKGLEKILSNSQDFLTKTLSALRKANDAITFLHNSQTDYNTQNYSSAYTNINTWTSTVTQYISNISTLTNSLTTDTNNLTTLTEGADPIDVKNSLLSVQEQERNYSNYFIRAPFDGIVARIPVNVYDRASSGTVIATIIGENKISNISLNEVDAQKVKAGQNVNITFDAIENFVATGTVQVVDLVGTVTQGVVSYNVRVSIDTRDDRIKPGMSINVEIITDKRNGVLAVPNSAIKTQGKIKYVEIEDSPQNTNATTTKLGIITTSVLPTRQTVETGISNDQFTEIINGLSGNEYVVIKTQTSTTQSSQTPNILSSIGAQRPQTNIRANSTSNTRSSNTQNR
jgi:multidrug efflux pump subunit AcrA (membrane-fusion protein)